MSRRSWRDGLLDDGIDFAERALHDGCAADSPCHTEAALVLSLLLAQVRRTDHAQAVLETVDGLVRARADDQLTATATLARSGVTLATGDFGKAAKLATAGLGEAERSGLKAWTPLGHFVLVQSALRQGHLSTAVRYAQKLKEDTIFQREMLHAGQAAWAVIQIAEAEKGRQHAVPLGAELLAADAAVRQLSIAEPAALPWLVRLMMNCGRKQLAAHGVHVCRQLASRNPHFSSVQAAAAHAAGLHDEDLGKLRLAAESHVDPWARASANEDIAVILARGDDRTVPARVLQQALDTYTQTGARRDASRIESRLHHSAPSAGQVSRHQRTRDIPELTDTEYAVAHLVAQGFTNGQTAGQLFLSPHTIAFHLRKIFRKLGVESRVQLASAWNDLAAPHTGMREHTTGALTTGRPSLSS
ncbi:helix-turn-helix transcriptional regulator [Streptomyces sp. NK08204]|uniref:helix-turn-helix transcriptional regulator n=1 Tax=Streptomyces sp. NK08204 TaxID=2873260 RepID=UPI001CED218F|nr:helix-turn-helix transcriptional regulator [Streptomyces sp. NK08204]